MPFPRRRASRLRAEPFAIVKGVQRGSVFMSAGTIADDITDITITAVNPAKCKCRFLGARTFGPVDVPLEGVQRSHVAMQLINSTTLRFARHKALDQGFTNNPASDGFWEITEYE